MSLISNYSSLKRTFFLLAVLTLAILSQNASGQMSRLTTDEFKQLLINAFKKTNTALSDSLIKSNRLMVKPFVNDLIKETIILDLNGKMNDSGRSLEMADKAAISFENFFGEKSLSLAIMYLKSWTGEQKESKLAADSLYSVGSAIRSDPQKREQALDYHKEALNIYRSIGDERGEAEVLGGLGLFYSTIDLENSLSWYEQALVARQKVDDRQLVGNSLNSLGAVYNNMGDYTRAILYFEQAEAVRSEIGDLPNLNRTRALKANSLLASGEELNNAGKYTESLNNLEKALEINKYLNSRSGTGKVLSQMGFVYSNLGDYNMAVEKLSEAIEILKEENLEADLAGAYNHLGIVLQGSGRLDKALEYYDNSLHIFGELNDNVNEIALLSNIGTVYFDKKDYLKAEEYLNRALQISREMKDKKLEGNCLLNLANTQSLLGKTSESVSNYESGLEISRSLNNPDLMWRFMVGIAENCEKKGEYGRAIELNDSALNIIDGIRSTLRDDELKAAYIARERFVFEDIISMLGSLHENKREKNYDILAYKYAEQSKSRVFLDLLAESLANVREGADSSLLKRQEEILTDLSHSKQLLIKESSKDQPPFEYIDSLKTKIRESEDVLRKLKAEIRNKNPRYAELQYPQTISLGEIKEMLPDDNTVLMEYSLGDSSSCLWVITRTDHKFFRLPARKILQDQIESIRFALLDPDNSNIDFITGTGYSLYRQLVKPAESYFEKKSRLIIIPDGILNYLPFEVLLSDSIIRGSITSFSDLPFLVKKYPLSYAQSGTVLKNLIAQRNESTGAYTDRKRIIALGDPLYKNHNVEESATVNSFSRLENSGKEVEKIASYFESGSADILLQDEATEDNIKGNGELKKYDFIHFATHGLIDENRPDFSSLVLTRNNNSAEDGFLRATEIFNLKIDADLVVLSACQTGLGKLIRGEGMVGLTRAFMYAGTPAVMVSLWSVSDISTATLMGEFYKNMLKGELNKTDALRKAQLTVLKDEKFAHPFYWAPFVIFGDWR